MANRQQARQAAHQRPAVVPTPKVEVPAGSPAEAASPGRPLATPHVDFDFIRGSVDAPLHALRTLFGHEIVTYFLADGAAIADEQMLHMYEHLRRVGHQPTLGLWLSSRGGATETPWKVVSLFREYCERFVVILPYRANSSATLISLGADEIVMTEMSELGPIDPSRRHPLLPTEDGAGNKKIPIPISVQDLRHVLKFLEREVGRDTLTPEAAAHVYTALFDKVHPLAIGALEQSWALAQQIGAQVLGTHMDREKQKAEIDNIVEQLSDHYKSHLYQINRNEARALGLPVRDATPTEAEASWNLYNAYSHLQVQGEATINGKKAGIGRLGHIDSRAGTTIGMGMTQFDDQTVQVINWESNWTLAPGARPPNP